MSGTGSFPNLLRKGHIGRLELSNRMVMSPMGTGFTVDGFVTDELVDYYVARARGGVGLIIVEGTCLDFPFVGIRTQMRIDDDKYVPGLSRLVKAIHEGGAPAALQMFHAGIASQSQHFGVQAVGPSPVALPGHDQPRGLSRDEIGGVIRRFADAARRAVEAGFDGIELHAAHRYIISNFLSPASNKRTDDYGGDLTSRARFMLEVIQAVRDVVGSDFPLWLRINCEEMGLPGGTTIDEATATAAMAEAGGADAIHISAFGYGHPTMWASCPREAGMLLPYAQRIKQSVSIPVIAVGRLDPGSAERALAKGQADFAAFGRPLIADPDLPRRVSEAKLEDVRPCIGCLKCRDSLIATGGPMTCSVNAAVGREGANQVEAAAQRKKVVVVGGGPAGMEAARVAAARGHAVVLFEKESELGGQLIPGAKPPEKAEISELREYLKNQVQKLGVRLEIGQAASAEAVIAEKPDAVVVATGTIPKVPELAGIASRQVVTALDVLANKVAVGKRVAVIGGELVGCETAELLAVRGKQVTVLRRGTELATGVNATARQALLKRLTAAGVRALTGVRYEEVTPEGVVITNAQGIRETVLADTVVLAAGGEPDRALEQALAGKVSELVLVGDCAQPRSILEAISDGQFAGLKI